MEFRHFARSHFRQNQLEDEDRTVETEGFRQFRVDRANEADQTTVTFDARGLTRVQRWVLAWHESERIQGTGKTQHRFHVCLDVKEVDGIATLRPAFRQATTANNTRQHRLLLQTFKLANETQAAFEQTHAILLTVQVVLKRLDQTRPQRRTHGSHVIGDRVGQQQRLNTRIKQFELFRIDEAVGNCFLIPTGNQQAAQFRQVATGFCLGLRRQTRLRITNRQTVVAIQACQFFDQVDFQADIEAMAWHFYTPLPCPVGSNGQAQGIEQTLHFGRIHFHTQHLGNALGTQGDRSNFRQVLFADGLDDRTRFTTGDFQQQTSRALHGFAGQLPVHATLIAMGCIGVQAIGTGLACYGDLIEEGTFQEHITGGRANTAVLATHDAGDCQCAGVVGNHQRIATQADFLTVEQHQLLALFGHAHTDATVDFGEIEGVQRLTQFQHHIVGDVDGSVDAAHVGTTQTLDHPQRRCFGQVDVTDHTPQVTWARGGRQHFYRAHFVVGGRNRSHHRTDHRSGVQGTHFTGQTGQGQAVTTVRGQIDLDAGVFQVQVNAEILAHRRIGRQLHQAVITFTDLQLGLRAQHAVGLDATQLGLLDLEVAWQLGADHGERNLQARAHVWRTANNLEGFRTVADLAHAQLVGVRVLLGAEHLANDHATENTGGRRNAIDLKTGHRQTSNQLVATYLRANPATQPLFTEFHPALLRIRYD
ncbi:hypothetical protein D3C85_738660 [compost metagenome]